MIFDLQFYKIITTFRNYFVKLQRQ